MSQRRYHEQSRSRGETEGITLQLSDYLITPTSQGYCIWSDNKNDGRFAWRLLAPSTSTALCDFRNATGACACVYRRGMIQMCSSDQIESHPSSAAECRARYAVLLVLAVHGRLRCLQLRRLRGTTTAITTTGRHRLRCRASSSITGTTPPHGQ